MPETLPFSEIEQRYPSEWVLIDQPQTDQSNHVVGGKVVYHSKDRDEVYRKALTLPIPRHFAVRFTGPPDPNMEFVL